MSERDTILTSIRPKIEVLTEKSCALETFQSQTLRPILKLQNSLILLQVRNFVKNNFKAFNAVNINEQKKYIRNSFKQDINLSKPLIYSIVGMFTSNELMFYNENHREVNKRITELLIERINSQIELLY